MLWFCSAFWTKTAQLFHTASVVPTHQSTVVPRHEQQHLCLGLVYADFFRLLQTILCAYLQASALPDRKRILTECFGICKVCSLSSMVSCVGHMLICFCNGLPQQHTQVAILLLASTSKLCGLMPALHSCTTNCHFTHVLAITIWQ